MRLGSTGVSTYATIVCYQFLNLYEYATLVNNSPHVAVSVNIILKHMLQRSSTYSVSHSDVGGGRLGDMSERKAANQ